MGFGEDKIVRKSPSEIEKMRRSGQHRPPGSEPRERLGRAGRDDHGPGESRGEADRGTRCDAGVQGILRLSLRALHFGERRDRARHPVGKAGAEGRRHCFDRLRSGVRRILRRRGDHRAGGRDAGRGSEEAARSDGSVACTRASSRRRSATRSAMWDRRSRSTWKRPDSASCASLSGTESGPSCTKRRRFRTSARKARAPSLSEGMVLAIEPMVNSGGPGPKVLSDKWTAVTLDGSYSAHFEHCVAVTKQGPVILTQ